MSTLSANDKTACVPLKNGPDQKAHQLYSAQEAVAEGGADSALARNVSEGGLGVCKACKCFEGSLATECPGEPVSGFLQDKIYERVLDFKGGQWIHPVALDALSADQRSALVAFKNEHGRNWKADLLAGWERAKYPGALQTIRNQFGPQWLNRLNPSDFSAVEPSSVDVFCALAQLGEDPSMEQAETVLAGLDDAARDRVVRAGSANEAKLSALRAAIVDSQLCKTDAERTVARIVDVSVPASPVGPRSADDGFSPN